MTIKLALDAMGGDAGIPMVIEGANLVLRNFKNTSLVFTFYGDLAQIQDQLVHYPQLSSCSHIVHCDTIVTNHTKPSQALRSGRHSNLGKAIQSVVNGENQAVISAGNTGAYMALSKVIFKTIANLARPAIPAIIPTIKGKTLVLDLGANSESSAELLVQFALMGEALAHYCLDKEKPSIGLLNIGSEELKGNAVVQEASQILRSIDEINFLGFVEGDDIAKGTADVVVTDGFTGNIVLKTIEGTALLIKHFLQESLSSSWRGKLGYLIAKQALNSMKKKTDPRLYNGAVFLGLKHIAVKSHGGTDAVGFSNAISVAIDMVQNNLIERIQTMLEKKIPSSISSVAQS